MTLTTSGSQVIDGGSQKLPLAQSLIRLATARANDVQALAGRNLPCTVSKVISPWIVEVNFEVTGKTLPKWTMPVRMHKSIALPIQVGDPGLAHSSSNRLGALSGLGSGTPAWDDLPGNLSALSFEWLGTTDYTAIDSEALCLNGNIAVTADKLGFFANSKVVQQDLTGALSSVSDPAAKAVLQSIVDALCESGYGLTKDQTT
jgi:hypothetical protein